MRTSRFKSRPSLHRDGPQAGVNQMVLCRSAFGRRGAYLPSALMFLMTLGWIGVNTYFPVKIAVAILGQFGIGDTWLTNQPRRRHRRDGGPGADRPLRLLCDPDLREVHGAD